MKKIKTLLSIQWHIVIVTGTMLIMMGSLVGGWLDIFFFDAYKSNVQGVDFFSLPKSFLNLLDRRSPYETWGGDPFGSYLTWYLSHPALTVFAGFWFSFFSPYVSYALFVCASVGLLLLCASLFSKVSRHSTISKIFYPLFLCAFPTYWLLFVGNPHAPVVVALTLLFIGIFQLSSEEYNDETGAQTKIFAGLILSLLTKPVVILFLPLLLIMKVTRIATMKSIIVYVIVSYLFLEISLLNPEKISWTERLFLLLHPEFVKENLNIYKNNFVINRYMKDNSIHWFNLIAQSDHKLMHVNIFSFSVFIETLIGKPLPPSIYKIPVIGCYILGLCSLFIKDLAARMRFFLISLLSLSLTFFLSYHTVWEYQFTSVAPVIGTLLLLLERATTKQEKNLLFLLIAIASLTLLPTLYFLVRHLSIDIYSLTMIRALKVIPVAVLSVGLYIYGLMLFWGKLSNHKVGHHTPSVMYKIAKVERQIDQ